MKTWLDKAGIIFFLYLSTTVNVSAFQLKEASIDSIHQAMKSKQINCLGLIEQYIEQIKNYNLAVQKLAPFNAITEINTSVLYQASELDRFYTAHNQLMGPLHCIPIVLKDNIDSFDTSTTSGSLSLLGSQPPKDAALVAQLRKAGAIILAKGGMDEFAWGMFGLSSRSGRIGNAYNANENPGGSSGGPAVAISANFAVIGIGTDNSGSVRIPAAFNGLVGLRPSFGLVSQQGIFPMGNLDGTAGPLARSVRDLAITLDAMVINKHISYVSFLNKNGLKNKRIGIVRHVHNIDTFENMPPDIKQLFANAVNTINQQGATLIDIELPNFDNNRSPHQSGEIQDVNTYLASFPATRKNFRDICESNRTKTFGNIKACLKFMNTMATKESRDYQLALFIFAKNKNYVHSIMAKYQLDALLIPISTYGSASYDGSTINTWRAPISSNTGLPSLAINMGYDKNHMPVGIEFIGKQFDEGHLLEIGYAFEQHQPSRIPPSMPAPDTSLLAFSIPQLNHLFTEIGYQSYEKILKNAKSDVELSELLTPEKSRQITKEVILNSLRQDVR